MNFSEYIFQHAQNQPKNSFILDDAGGFMSWQNFWRQVDNVADKLRQHNIGENKKLVLALESRTVWLSCFFAAIKIGAIPVLVNFHDHFQLNAIVSGNDLIICSDAEKGEEPFLPKGQIIIRLSDKWPFESSKGLASDFSGNRDKTKIAQKDKHDIFLGLYTSGSEGKPKYVEKTYENIMTELKFLQPLLSLAPSNIIFSVVPYLHIYGLLFGVLLPAMVGSKVVHSSTFLPREAFKAAVKYHADFFIAAPIHFHVFLKAEIKNFGIHYWKMAISSGAPLSMDIAQDFVQQSQTSILELYGATETGGVGYRIWDSSLEEKDFRLFPYIETKFARCMEPFPDEQPDNKPDEQPSRQPDEFKSSELVIKSPGITQTFCNQYGWYHTGDMAHFLKDKHFKILGRKSHIIKSGGKRISVEQLEMELNSIAEVKAAGVIRIEEQGLRGEGAVAFVQYLPSTPLSAVGIREKLKKISSHHGVIRKIIIIEKIPRKSNSKIDYPELHKIYKQHK